MFDPDHNLPTRHDRSSWREFDFVYVNIWSFIVTIVMMQGAAMDVDDDDDPVPEITKRHFEEAMKFARRWDIVALFML